MLSAAALRVAIGLRFPLKTDPSSSPELPNLVFLTHHVPCADLLGQLSWFVITAKHFSIHHAGNEFQGSALGIKRKGPPGRDSRVLGLSSY